MYQQCELWYEPSQKLYEKQEFVCEMNSLDHGFLCGMIKKVKPKKIVEIGVAEGGTTAVIMETLVMLGLESEVWSVDLSEKLYYDDTKEIGCEFKRLKRLCGGEWGVHHLLLGKTVAGWIDGIGNNIDMVILDTLHKMPSEILDFLSVFPYLAPNATIILHDINLNYSRAVLGNNEYVISSKDSIATKVLLSTVVADKYMVLNQGKFPNIAAFTINECTKKYIEDVFYVLSLTWAYTLEQWIIQEYRSLFCRHYSEACVNCFDIVVKNNIRILERIDLNEKMNCNEVPIIKYMFPYNQIPEGSKIVIYGAGCVGKEVHLVQSKRNIYNITAWVDKNSEEYVKMGMEVATPEELIKHEFDYIVVAVECESVFEEICNEILKNNWNKGKKIVGPIKRY